MARAPAESGTRPGSWPKSWALGERAYSHLPVIHELIVTLSRVVGAPWEIRRLVIEDAVRCAPNFRHVSDSNRDSLDLARRR